MCRRYTLSADGSRLERIPWIDEFRTNHRPQYNIAPGKLAPIVRSDRREHLILDSIRWGLVPSWADDPSVGYRLPSVSVHEVNTDPAFQTSFRARRCLLLADGFYLWRSGEDGTRRLCWFHRPDRSIFAIAGVWEEWASKRSHECLLTFAMLTIPERHDAGATVTE